MRHHHAHGGILAVVLGLVLLTGCDTAATPDRDDPDAAPASPGTDPDPDAGTTPAGSGTVTLAFAGDIHFEDDLASVPANRRSTLGPMSRALRSADLAVANLETAVVGRGRPARKELEAADNRFWFRTPPAALDVLDRSGIDVVSVANNHGADYGAAGLRETIRIAEQSPVPMIGVGQTYRDAFEPYRATVEGTEVAVFAADASPRESADSTWAAAPGSGPGIASARGRDTALLVESVRASASTDDLVVVYLHWGEELENCSTGAQESLARQLSEAGADIVVGAHAHVPLGAGSLGDTYVSYGLGNFFWYHGNQSETGVLRLRVQDGEVVGDQWRPGRIRPEGGNPQPLTGGAREGAVSDWRGLRGCTDLEPGPTEAAATAAAAAEAEGTPGGALPAFTSTTRRIVPAVRAKLTSYDPATCPVPLSDLRHLTLAYVGFDGAAHRGVMIVNAEVADEVVEVFSSLYESRFPIRRMRLVDAYDGDDDRSMAANNTSGFNCRVVAGTSGFSSHAYGRAVDINPVQNPYLLDGTPRPPAGARFVAADRSADAQAAPGVIRAGDVVRRAFARIGWRWGGDFAEPDFQHFDKP